MAAATLTDIYDPNRASITQQELNVALAGHERFVRYQGGKRMHMIRRRLDGLNLANRVLTDSEFSGCSFVGATLYGSNLERASLYCADLRDADLQGANLIRADLRGAAFKGANLAFAVLDGADLRSARMMIMGPEGTSSIDHVEKGRVDFSNCSLRNVSFGNAKLDDADFSGAMLQGAKFNGASLANAKFHGAVLTGVNLKDLGASPEALEGCILDVSAAAMERSETLRSAIAGHEEWVSSEGARGSQAVFDKEDLRPLKEYLAGRRLAGCSARGALAVGVNLTGCRLQAAKLDGADLRGANLSECDLRGASLRGTNLSHARLDKAVFGPLRLANGGLMPMTLDGMKATKSQFSDAIVECALPAFS
jgi:uncharacterized protein YjbI with pentapeptide repeats